MQLAPLIRAGRVLARPVALSDFALVVLVVFSSLVVVGNGLGRRQVWNLVLEVGHPILIRHVVVRERGVGTVTDARLAEVSHLDVVARLDELHSCELSLSSSQAVTSSLDRGRRVLLDEPFNL